MSYSPPGSFVCGISQARILSGLPFPPPEDLPDSEIEPESLISPALAGRFFTTSTRAEKYWIHLLKMIEPGDSFESLFHDLEESYTQKNFH